MHAAPGRGTLLASLWDMTWVQEMLGLVEAAYWTWSWSVLPWPSRNPKPFPRALQWVLQRSKDLLEDAFVLVHAGVQDPMVAASRLGPEATSATCPCFGFPICAKPGGGIFPEMLSEEVTCHWGKAQEWQSWWSCALCWGCPHCGVAVEVEMLL